MFMYLRQKCPTKSLQPVLREYTALLRNGNRRKSTLKGIRFLQAGFGLAALLKANAFRDGSISDSSLRRRIKDAKYNTVAGFLPR